MKNLGSYLPARRDVITAVLFAVLYYASSRFLLDHGWRPRPRSSYELAAVFTTAVLVIRNRYPLGTLLMAAVLYPTVYAQGWPLDLATAPILIAAYAAANSGRIRALWIAMLAGAGVLSIYVAPSVWWNFVLHPVTLQQEFYYWNLSHIGLAEAAVLSVVLLGRAAYKQRRATAQLLARHREIERLRRIETDQVVIAERTRIARELHDVVAHHISAVVIRAQAADRVAGDRPEETREAVRWIAASGQETLAAMRHVVRVLRSAETGVALTPQATLAELPPMAGRLREVGLDVDLHLPPVPPVLPAPVELAAVRIVQEALTNVLVHARATRAVVELRMAPDGLQLDIQDDGTASAPPTQPIEVVTADTKLPAKRNTRPDSVKASRIVSGQPFGGNGLVGMRERATSCGGWLAIGTSPLGGWQISAFLRTPLSLPGDAAAPVAS